jgi:hypothetical protein
MKKYVNKRQELSLYLGKQFVVPMDVHSIFLAFTLPTKFGQY